MTSETVKKEKPLARATVEVALLRASEDNPRKMKDGEQEVQALADSMKEVGLLQPILVRPVTEPEGGTVYEIVCGHRRARAALLLGWDRIQATVVEMDEDKIDTARVIENVQRRDLTPLEECGYYSYLAGKYKLHVPDLAAKLGKTKAHVAKILSLESLIPAASLKLAAGEMPVWFAFQMAPLMADQQKGIMQSFANVKGPVDCTPYQLREFIEQNFMLDLTKVPWKLDDAELVKKAGACSACPKRTGAGLDLFPGIDKDTCTDPKCFAGKMDVVIAGMIKADPAIVKLSAGYTPYGQKAPKDILRQGEFRRLEKGAATCEHTKVGVWIDGERRGTKETVCASARCSVHDPYAENYREGRKADAKLRLESKIKKETRRQTLDEILKKVDGPLDGSGLRLLLTSSFSRLWHDAQKEVFRAFKWEPKKGKYGMMDYLPVATEKIENGSATDLHRFALAIALAGDLGNNSEAKDLKGSAAYHKVDMAGIEKAVRTTAMEKKKPKVKKAPGKGAPKGPGGGETSAKKSGPKASRKSPPAAGSDGSEE